jgi:hypothetical protein
MTRSYAGPSESAREREHDPGDAGSVTVSEFMFLAIGLVLGVASGAALIEIIRARPPAGREVRLTVARDAIPRRRASTLSDDAFVTVGPEPARGGPADRRGVDLPTPAGTSDRRTNVLTGPRSTPTRANAGNPDGDLVGMPISAGPDPMLDALQAGSRDASRSWAVATTRHPRTNASGSVAMATRRHAAVALMDPPAPVEVSEPTPAPTFSGPCAEERRVAHERCELATRAQAQATAAADALRRAQRAYDSHSAAAESASEEANPRSVRTLKEEAQRRFRSASQSAGSPDAVEAAATTWLQDINRINRESASASLVADRERAIATDIGARLERMSLDADAARVGAEMANAACVAARSVVADCDERTANGTTTPAAKPTPAAVANPQSAPNDAAPEEALGVALTGGGEPRIFRLLRGEPEALDTLVARLADDREEQGRWKLAVGGLLEAILTDATEQAYLRFPPDHQFWGPQTLQQNRDITKALGSLGYRFDGVGGWLDERTPTQRELSLAFSYAGLDPMRVRHWPNEQQTRDLLAEVEVAADEYLAGVAGDLTLAEMVEMLGRRADNLVDLWNNWGRVRPLLLEER